MKIFKAHTFNVSSLASAFAALFRWLTGYKKLTRTQLNQMNFNLMVSQGFTPQKRFQLNGQDLAYLMERGKETVALFFPTDDQQTLDETLKHAANILEECDSVFIPIAETKGRAHFTLLIADKTNEQCVFLDPKTKRTFYNKKFGTYNIEPISKAVKEHLGKTLEPVYRSDQIFRTSTCGWHTAAYIESTVDPRITQAEIEHKTKFKELYQALEKDANFEACENVMELGERPDTNALQEPVLN